jgi:hypothetical protein
MIDDTLSISRDMVDLAKETNVEGMEKSDIMTLISSYNLELSNEELLKIFN